MSESIRSRDRYLRAILALSRRYFCVRSVDVAQYLSCSKASVSVMTRQLIAEGLLSVGENGALSLTEAGVARVSAYDARCFYFQQLLEASGVPAPDAEREGAALAGSLSQSSFALLRTHLNN